jgi:hypothetical protein
MQILSQRDPKWAGDKLGASSLTLGRWGCTTTCISMLSDYFKCFKSPLEIAHNVSNYTPDGLILWQNLRFDKMCFVRREYVRNDQAIQEALKNPNKSVILQVNNKAHWVVALRKSFGGNDYLVADPWDGTKCWVIEKYHNITGAAYFESTVPATAAYAPDPFTLYKGRTIKVAGSANVFFVYAKKRFLIPDWTTFTVLFGSKQIDEVTDQVLNQFTDGGMFPSLT